jgi:hypothetical protein
LPYHLTLGSGTGSIVAETAVMSGRSLPLLGLQVYFLFLLILEQKNLVTEEKNVLQENSWFICAVF